MLQFANHNAPQNRPRRAGFSPLAVAIALCVLAAPLSVSAKDEIKPVQIEISAPRDKVKAAIISTRAREGWRLDKESESSVVLSIRAGLAAQMSARMGGLLRNGEEARATDTYTITALDGGITLIVIDMAVTVDRASGGQSRQDYNRDKKYRKEAAAFLAKIKTQLEK